jgi:hypothetical protein
MQGLRGFGGGRGSIPEAGGGNRTARMEARGHAAEHGTLIRARPAMRGGEWERGVSGGWIQ